MFTCTLHKNGMRKLAAAALCGVLLAGTAFGIGALHGEEALETAAPGTAQKIEGAEDAALFLKGYGIDTDLSTAQVGTVRIPRKWDDDFKAFNDVLQQSGTDLSRFKNKKADKWMLRVPAMTTEEKMYFAVVLVCREKVCGAYLLEQPSGEVLPLPAAAPAPAAEILPETGAQQVSAAAQMPQESAEQTAQMVQELPEKAGFPTE